MKASATRFHKPCRPLRETQSRANSQDHGGYSKAPLSPRDRGGPEKGKLFTPQNWGAGGLSRGSRANDRKTVIPAQAGIHLEKTS